MIRARIARLTLAVCVGLIIAGLWVRVAVDVSPWVAVVLLVAAIGLAAVVGGVMAASGAAVVRHAEQTRRAIAAIEASRRKEITR